MSIAPKTRKGQATKSKMINVAAQLMHKNGVHATTVNDILSHSKTGKSQFSHYFGSKESLIIEVIHFHAEASAQEQERILAEMFTLADLRKLTSSIIERQALCLKEFGAGCPIGQIALETSSDNYKVLGELQKAFGRTKHGIADFLLRMQQKGEMIETADTTGLAEFFSSAVHGGIVLAKTNQSVEPLQKSLEHTVKYLCTFKKPTSH